MSPSADIELTLYRQDQQYAVDFRYSDSDPAQQTEVRLGAGQAAYASFDFPKLEEHFQAGEIKEYGQVLTQSLFASEPLRTVFAQARTATEQAGAVLRLRLNIHPSALDLHTLRWETLLDPHSGISLSTDQNVYFSRYLSGSDWRSIKPRAKGEKKEPKDKPSLPKPSKPLPTRRLPQSPSKKPKPMPRPRLRRPANWRRNPFYPTTRITGLWQRCWRWKP